MEVWSGTFEELLGKRLINALTKYETPIVNGKDRQEIGHFCRNTEHSKECLAL